MHFTMALVRRHLIDFNRECRMAAPDVLCIGVTVYYSAVYEVQDFTLTLFEAIGPPRKLIIRVAIE